VVIDGSWHGRDDLVIIPRIYCQGSLHLLFWKVITAACGVKVENQSIDLGEVQALARGGVFRTETIWSPPSLDLFGFQVLGVVQLTQSEDNPPKLWNTSPLLYVQNTFSHPEDQPS
jgi:hypothetical protein